MSNRIFPTRANKAYEKYGRELTSAVRDRFWVEDPSFALASDELVYEKLKRDAVAAQLMTFRRHLVAGRGFTVVPASDDPRSKQVAGIVEELLGQVGRFTDARFALAEAVFRGSAYAFVEGRRVRMAVAGTPALDWWVPTNLVDVDRRRWRLRFVPEQGRHVWHLFKLETRSWEPLGEDQVRWFVRHRYRATEDTLGYGSGLVDAMHFYQASKMRLLQEGLAAAERSGQGFLTVAIDGDREGSTGKSNDELAADYAEQLANHRARGVFVHMKGDEAKLVSGFGEGWQLIRELLNYLDNSLRVLVLGSNLPTSATGGGSFALAEIQENSTEALVQFDREALAETLTRDLVGLVWRLNARNLAVLGMRGVRMPSLAIRQEKRADPQVAAQVITAALAAGIPLRRDEVYERLGFTVPADGDDVVTAPAGLAVPPGLELPDLGGPAPFACRAPVGQLSAVDWAGVRQQLDQAHRHGLTPAEARAAAAQLVAA